MKTKLTIDKEILKDRQREVNKLCDEAKVEFYNKKIIESEGNSKDLFRLSNTLLHKQNDSALPTHSSEKDLANKFGTYFKEKITALHSALS